MKSQINDVKTCIDMSLKVIRMYDWLLDLYVLDFFVDNHWYRLPKSWQENLDEIALEQLGNILSEKPTNHTFPLSLLALIATVKALGLPRKNSKTIKKDVTQIADQCSTYSKIKNLFLKHVKLKKRHEVSVMAEIVTDVALKSRCNAVIDFGSGLGHLVRMLAYKNKLYTAGIECQKQLTEEARKLDLEFEYTARKYTKEGFTPNLHRPIHYNISLSNHEQLQHLPLPTHMTNYGLIGLHPCGDLGPLLLKHFICSNQVKFICVVGCCYTKLTAEGYPISNYLKKLKGDLSFVSREIACHAIEMYSERLRQGLYEDLKVHAYRAALEKILVEHNPKLKHAPVRSLKHTQDLSFEKYCSMAVEKLCLRWPLPDVSERDMSARDESVRSVSARDLSARDVLACGVSAREVSAGAEEVREWRRVVVVYTLRLALAPLVETVLLLDRLLFVLEHGLSCEIRPIFDPKLSPRNHVIIARKPN